MNSIYLMIDEKKTFCLVKVGYTQDIDQRVYSYTTHNPLAECFGYIKTQDRSGRKIEALLRKELKARGYRQVNAIIDNKTTEWFAIDYNDEFYTILIDKSLNAFRATKNHKLHHIEI